MAGWISCGVGALEALLGVGTLCGTTGAGVGDDLVVPSTGVSIAGFSAAVTGDVNDWLACMAVVRMALNSNMLFCLLLPSPTLGADLLVAASASVSVVSGIA